MSIHLTSCAAEQPIPAAVKLALMAFADAADDYTHVSFPGHEKVQKWASVGRSRSAELVAELVDLNLLRKHRGGHRGRRAEYIVFPNGCCPLHPRHTVDEDLADDDQDPGQPPQQGSTTADPNSLFGSGQPDPNHKTEKGSGIPDSSGGKGSTPPDPNRSGAEGSGPADPSRAKRPERVRHSGPLPKQVLTTPLTPTSGGTEPTGCSRHPTAPGTNCRACGTSPKQLAAHRRELRAEQKRIDDMAATRRDREARTTSPPASRDVIASVKSQIVTTRSHQ